MSEILIVDPDAETRASLRELLAPRGFRILETTSAAGALLALTESDVEIVLLSLELPDRSGIDLLTDLAPQLSAGLAVVLMAAFGSVEDAVRGMRAGAQDVLAKPFADEQMLLAVQRAREKHHLVRENADLRTALDDRLKLDNFVATDPKMHSVFKTVRAVAETKTTVLITGESGTGKTVLARAIHNLSGRRNGPFIEVNCGALPESLLESELFGHRKGAFTGATEDRPGKFEAASGGTIFLDEIGTSTPQFQIKLLRVLQDRIVERVGETETRTIDVRIVLATNLDLEQAVANGTFREDLFYRINVVATEMPPLRDRRDDIVLLARAFLERFARDTGKPVRGFTPRALQILQRASWPGNVRQLENVVERAVVLSESEVLDVRDLPPAFSDGRSEEARRSPPTPPRESAQDRDPHWSANAHASKSHGAPAPGTQPNQGHPNDHREAMVETLENSGSSAPAWPEDVDQLTLREALEIPERDLIQKALARHQGNRRETAESLGINRSTLFNKMRKLGLL